MRRCRSALEADCFLDEVGHRWFASLERETTVFVDRDDGWKSPARSITSLVVELLTKVSNLDTGGSQSRTDWRRRVCSTSSYLELDDSFDFLFLAINRLLSRNYNWVGYLSNSDSWEALFYQARNGGSSGDVEPEKCVNRISSRSGFDTLLFPFVLVGPLGIEPRTAGLRGRCSTDWAKNPSGVSIRENTKRQGRKWYFLHCWFLKNSDKIITIFLRPRREVLDLKYSSSVSCVLEKSRWNRIWIFTFTSPYAYIMPSCL